MSDEEASKAINAVAEVDFDETIAQDEFPPPLKKNQGQSR
jgi:hypothetical protein